MLKLDISAEVCHICFLSDKNFILVCFTGEIIECDIGD